MTAYHIFTSMSGVEWEVEVEEVEEVAINELLLCFHEQFE
jgi:hypothetical protein